MTIKPRYFTFILAFVFSLSVGAEIKEVTLLHTNDIESVYEPIQATWRDDIELIGGTPYLASLIYQIRKNEPISFLMDAGDIYTGALSKKSKGKLPFDLYSAMEYDVITLGNHEFEYGWESLVETMPRASFPVLNANIVYQSSNSLIAQPYTIIQRDGVRIGVVGVMGIDAFYNTTAKFQRVGLTIKDPTESVQYWVDKIHDDVNMIVVLTHQNKTAPMQTNKESDPSVQRGFDEDYAMAGKLKNVDVIFGGHSDNGLLEPVMHPKTGVVIGLTFGQGMHLGYTRFSVDTDINRVSFLEGKLIPVNVGKLQRDEATYRLIEKVRQANPELMKQIATLDKTALRRYNRESSIGNLLTDIMREQSGADVAMINSGAIRTDFNSGKVTKEHLINVYPFVDKLTTIELTSAQLLNLVEYSSTLPYGIGQFSGLTMTINFDNPPMQRVTDLKVAGKSIEPNKRYTVATTGFVAAGGDGYEVFTKGKLVSANTMMSDALLSGFHVSENIKVPLIERQRVIKK